MANLPLSIIMDRSEGPKLVRGGLGKPRIEVVPLWKSVVMNCCPQSLLEKAVEESPGLGPGHCPVMFTVKYVVSNTGRRWCPTRPIRYCGRNSSLEGTEGSMDTVKEQEEVGLRLDTLLDRLDNV